MLEDKLADLTEITSKDKQELEQMIQEEDKYKDNIEGLLRNLEE